MTFQLFQKRVAQFLKIEILLQLMIIFPINILFSNFKIWPFKGGVRDLNIVLGIFTLIAVLFSINRLVYYFKYIKLEKKINRLFIIEILIFLISSLALLEWNLNTFSDFFKKLTPIFDSYYRLDISNHPFILGFFLVIYIGYTLDLFVKMQFESNK